MIETLHLQLLLATFAGWVGRQQSQAIAYLVEENRVLKEQLTSGGKRLRFTDDQRCRLAAKGKPLGRKVLLQIATIVTPDTILVWHRKLIAAKWTYPRKRVGRPGVMKEIRSLIVRMAEENPNWGYARIQGALKHLDHRVARSTISKVLKEHGIKPSPDRPLSWRTFVRSHAHLIAAADFFTTEVWTARGLVRYFTLFVIDIATRRVYIAGTTTHPDSAWMEQIARNLTDCYEGFLIGKRFLIIDRDAIFSPRFTLLLNGSDIEILLTAYQAPNMNAYAERFVRSIKSECLDQMIFLGRESLVRAIAEYAAHYHDERSHQGIGNEMISGAEPQCEGTIGVNERLGGLLKYYHRRAA
jgi:transposase InsO family protein